MTDLDYEKVVYSRQPMGFIFLIESPPLPSAFSMWLENFVYCYGRLITFFVFWGLFYLLFR